MTRFTAFVLLFTVSMLGQATPTAQPAKSPIPLVATELSRFGFYPPKVTLPAGTFVVHVRNRTGLGTYTLLLSNQDTPLAAAQQIVVDPVTNHSSHWKQTMTLPKGTYTIVAPLAGYPDRKFTIILN